MEAAFSSRLFRVRSAMYFLPFRRRISWQSGGRVLNFFFEISTAPQASARGVPIMYFTRVFHCRASPARGEVYAALISPVWREVSTSTTDIGIGLTFRALKAASAI